MFSNDHARLSHYRTSLRGRIDDYVIRFNETQTNLDFIIDKTSDIVDMLVTHYRNQDKTISARLVARVKYENVNTKQCVTYYHPSFQAEVIEDPHDFFFTHMLKIGERMDSFNRNGSNLVIISIEEIHVHINVAN